MLNYWMILTLLIVLLLPSIWVGFYFYRFRKLKIDFLLPILSQVSFILFIPLVIHFGRLYYFESFTVEDLYVFPGIPLVAFILTSIYHHYYLLKNTWAKIKYLKYFYMFVRIYVIICIAMFIMQTNLIFSKVPKDVNCIQFVQKTNKNFKTITLDTRDWEKLSGYYIPGNNSWNEKNPKPLIVYFWWNASDVCWFFTYADKLPDYSIVSFNYRWYWESSGSPWVAMTQDVESIYNYVIKTYPNTEKIFVWRSVWTAFASMIFKYDQSSKIALITPFDRFIDRAKEQYSFLPVSMLLRYRFDNRAIFNNKYRCDDYDDKCNYKTKLWIFVAEKDEVIDSKFWISLYNNISTVKKELKIIKDAMHNDILDNKDFWTEFNKFLQEK